MAKHKPSTGKTPSNWGYRGSRHERGYGSAWVKLRAWILKRDGYLCQECLRAGKITALMVKPNDHAVDHIIPKAKGGPDDGDNLQSLCAECHDTKSIADQRRRVSFSADGWPTGLERFGYSIPDGVRHSGIPVMLVSGPPASGKSHYIKTHATDIDTVIDFDECRKAVGGTKWDTRKEIWRAAFAMRDRLIHDLHNKREGRAYLIVTAPTHEERQTWKRALGDVTIVVINTPEAECIRRIRADPEREAAANSQIGAVKAWWATN